MSPSGPDNALRYVAFHDFGGVDLSAAPDEPTCIDQLNVESLERRGAVYTRPAWMNRGPGLDDPIVAFQHGRVQGGSDSADVSAYITPATATPWLGPALGGHGILAVRSNALEAVSDPGTVYHSALYSSTGADMEVYCTVSKASSDLAASPVGLYARYNRGAGAGYRLYVYPSFGGSGPGTGLVMITKVVGHTVTLLDQAEFVWGASSSFGLRAIGSTLEAWYKPSGGSWTFLFNDSDSTYTSGLIGVYMEAFGTSNPVDDFGGGAISAANLAPATPVLDNFNRADETPVGGGPQLVAYNHDEGTQATKTVAASTFLDAAQFSAPSGSVVLATENVKTATNVGLNIVEADASTPYVKITPMAASGGPGLDWVRFVDVQQPDNRAVVAGVASGVNHEARVWFSNPQDYTTWDADDYVDLDPNDGEVFTGTANLGGQLWIFKETKAFVFYGNSVDQFGGPKFNYRAIDLGTRCVPRNIAGSWALGEGVVAGEDGIYFVGTDGIYLVDGRDSAKVSEPVSAIMKGWWRTSGIGGGSSDRLAAGLHYADRRLFVNLGGLILVWDELRRGWLIWQAPAPDGVVSPVPWIGAAGVDDPSPALALFGHEDGNNLWGLARLSERGTVKDGDAPIPARYRHGFYDLGSDYEDRLEQTRVTGTGTVKVTVTRDFEKVADGLSETLDLGGNGSHLDVPGEKVFRHGMSGVVFSHQLEGDAPWAVHRIVQAISSQKAAGTR